jgi:hypothetical protein
MHPRQASEILASIIYHTSDPEASSLQQYAQELLYKGADTVPPVITDYINKNQSI